MDWLNHTPSCGNRRFTDEVWRRGGTFVMLDGYLVTRGREGIVAVDDQGQPFDRWLRERRAHSGLTQAQLAERAGVSLRAVRNAELGIVRQPRPDTAQRLRAALGPDAPAGGDVVRIGVLGPLTARRGEQHIEVGAAKQRWLLALLALQPNQVVRRDEIVDLLWDDRPPASCLELVHTYVARLRKALESGQREPSRTIVTAKGGYLLAAAEDQLDLLGFDALVSRADTALNSGDVAVAARCFRSALGMWRGPALAGLDRFRQHPARLALVMRRASVVLSYADVALAEGNHDEAVTHLRALTAEEPLHETAHARLMLALAGSGRQAAALELFDDIRRRLGTEFGIEPGSELREAQTQVLRQDVGKRTVAAAAPKRPAQLPADVAGFRGREEHLTELDRLVPGEPGATDVRIAVVSGTAGVGKTAVVVRWAHRTRERFPDGQLYVDLRGYGPGQPVEPGDVLSGFLRALGVAGTDIPSEIDERAAKYRTVLHGLRVLLVLDNAGSVQQVRPLLPGSTSCFVVVTSRDSLPGLIARDGARRLPLDLLAAAEAFDLLRTLLGGRVDVEPEAAAELVEYSARLPLALRLVAELAISRPRAALRELVAELADERGRLDLLDGGGDPETAVRAVFSWSYRHLPADAARVFRLWGLQPGRDFTLGATAALAACGVDEAQRLTETLARAHLVEETAPGRFQLHDLLRVYAAELAGREEARGREALTRLFDYYVYAASRAVDVVSPLERHLRPDLAEPALDVGAWPDADNAQTWLETERRNLLAVASYTTRNGWPEHLRQLSAVLWHYLDVGGYHEDSLVLHTHASALAHDAGDRAGEADPMTLVGLGHWRVGRSREALRYLEEALVIARETGNRSEPYVLTTLGLVCRALGRFADAHGYGEAALELTSDPGGEALVRVVLGISCRNLGRFDEAVEQFERGLALVRETGDRTTEGYLRTNLGDVLEALGRHEEAIRSLEAGLDLFRATGTHTSEAYALCFLGDVHRGLGHYDKALECLEQALAISRETGGRTNESVALKNLGDVHQELGHHHDAARYLDDALAIARDCDDRGVESRILVSLGALWLSRGGAEEAADHYREALAIAQETGGRGEQAFAHRGLGDACRRLGVLDQAREQWASALALYEELPLPDAQSLRECLDA
jgi:DNA-binding SARP family transcriptional activator/Flp pilus assembly protein TadD/DNA-binding XRE family transcriptional regulator